MDKKPRISLAIGSPPVAASGWPRAEPDKELPAVDSTGTVACADVFEVDGTGLSAGDGRDAAPPTEVDDAGEANSLREEELGYPK
jgi:hypothetical protein